jgi:FlaA1/EpsC-like NDP-sugar epimerase
MFQSAKYRRTIIVFFEIGLVLLANYIAFWLRFDGEIPPQYFGLFFRALPIVVAIRALSFIPFKLYEGLWRYTSIWDLRNIGGAILSSTALIFLILNPLLGLGYPRSVVIIDSLLLIFFMTGVRLTRRIVREIGIVPRKKGILIYGAGDAGEMVVRDMRNNSFYKMDPIGFVDDDFRKVGLRIHGVPVLGTRKDLKEIMSRSDVEEVLIAMPTASAAELRSIVKALEPYQARIATLPSLRDLLDRKVTVSQIRSLSLEDLLPRAPVGLDPVPVRNLIAGKRVVVTGAGGSIGSELCRQIVKMNPETLILVERHEHSIYTIEQELLNTTACKIVAKIADVTDRKAIRAALAEWQPHLVFHAAAHKHVPLLEANVCEGITNNVTGTRTMAEESELAGVERFILISTDKAVDPISVMGSTKRVSELLLQSLAQKSATCFNIVRFGNVLGSNGSVVPLFLEQIRKGGPVTVTDPAMRRYFMLVPEAVQLVLHAAALGDSGSLYILDMGEEFKVLELASNLIRLSGHIPDEDIRIEFIGLRPGEKLRETLVGADESSEPSTVEKIQKVWSTRAQDGGVLRAQISTLEAAAATGDADAAIALLSEILPTFRLGYSEPVTAGKLSQAALS